MFDELSSRFEDAVKGLRGKQRLVKIILMMLKGVRALLDADVSLSVVKVYIRRERQRIGKK